VVEIFKVIVVKIPPSSEVLVAQRLVLGTVFVREDAILATFDAARARSGDRQLVAAVAQAPGDQQADVHPAPLRSLPVGTRYKAQCNFLSLIWQARDGAFRRYIPWTIDVKTEKRVEKLRGDLGAIRQVLTPSSRKLQSSPKKIKKK
jgi:hypothetical protein